MQSNMTASAMKYGFILGVFFSLNFLFSITNNAVMAFLSNLLFAFSIILAYRFAIRFRELENNGIISYGRALSYVLLLFLFASIISGAVVLVYSRFINPTFLVGLNETMRHTLEGLTIVQGVTKEQIDESLNLLLSPTMYAFQYIWGNTFLGLIAGLIMAFFVKKQPTDT